MFLYYQYIKKNPDLSNLNILSINLFCPKTILTTPQGETCSLTPSQYFYSQNEPTSKLILFWLIKKKQLKNPLNLSHRKETISPWAIILSLSGNGAAIKQFFKAMAQYNSLPRNLLQNSSAPLTHARHFHYLD